MFLVGQLFQLQPRRLQTCSTRQQNLLLEVRLWGRPAHRGGVPLDQQHLVRVDGSSVDRSSQSVGHLGSGEAAQSPAGRMRGSRLKRPGATTDVLMKKVLN